MNTGSIATAPPTAPHALASNSVSRIMLTVVATLLPATLYGFWLYGWPAIFLWIITVLSAPVISAIRSRVRWAPGATLPVVVPMAASSRSRSG